MSASDSVILMEFNELCPSLMAQFMAAGHLPNFQRLHAQSQVFTTDAEEEPPNLQPWVQWVTVHSGLPFREHRVFDLGKGHELRRPNVWDVLSQNGRRVWVCGSMNVRYDAPLNGYLLPDAWSAGAPPYPDELLPYYRFVQQHVQEYTNERVPLTRADYLAFVRFMAAHGLSARTVMGIVRQLVSERTGPTRWKRAVILDQLQFNLFTSVYRRLAPHFSSFFLNSTAHYQHFYWRNMEPEVFKVKPTADDQRAYAEAVLFGYRQMDELVGGFLKLAAGRATLILCTALSQQPCLKYEDEGGKSFYRPRDFDKLLAFAGVEGPYTVSPVMSEEFHVVFPRPEAAVEAQGRLLSLRVDGRPCLKADMREDGLFVGCSVFVPLPAGAVLSREGGAPGPFFDVFYQVDGMKSGMHHPDGILWIRTPERTHRVHSGRVSLTSIAPTVLEMLGCSPPPSMRGPSLSAAMGARGAIYHEATAAEPLGVS
jgi:hypothetical protein